MIETTSNGAVVSMAAAAEPVMLEHALRYLRMGLPIFAVCSPDPAHPGDPDDPEDHGLCREHAARGQTCDKPGKGPLVSWKARQTSLPTEFEVRRLWAQ